VGQVCVALGAPGSDIRKDEDGGESEMTYLQAVMMQQEMSGALKFRGQFPDKYKEVASKYSALQWMECRKALLEHLQKEEEQITDMVKLAIQTRRGWPYENCV
jgi:hypothetical protein